MVLVPVRQVAIALSDILQFPAHLCRELENELFGVGVDRLLEVRHGGVVIDMTFAPLPEIAVAGYEPERGRVSIWPGGDIYAFPLGPERSWKHRYTSPLGGSFGHLAAELCLFYVGDPRGLRWEWDDGLDQYVTRVHRHLFYEEYNRREGHWPVEDAPHGGAQVGAHPIRSAFMRNEVHRWAS